MNQIEEDMNVIKGKITQVEALYKKHLLPGFDDRQVEEESMERLSEEITLVTNSIRKKLKTFSSFNRVKKRLKRFIMNPCIHQSQHLYSLKY